MKRARPRSSLAVALASRRVAATRTRSATSRSTATAAIERLGRPALRLLRPRHGRDPDLPGEAAGGGSTRAAYARRLAAERCTSTRRRHAGRALAPLEARARLPAGRRRACTRRGSRSSLARPARSRHGAGSPTATRNYAGRIGWKEIVVRPRRRARTPSSAPIESSATSCSPTRRTCSRARSTSPRRRATLAPGDRRRARRRR